MAAITQRLIRLRPVHGNQPHHLRLFSSSSDNGPPSEPNPEPESQSQSPSQPSFSSYFRDVKASLQNEPSPQNRPPTLRKPPSPYNPSLPPPPPPQTHPPSRLAYLEEIRSNLSGFRNVSAPPPPPPVSSSVSLQDLYNRHTSLNNETSPSNAEALKPNVAPTFGSIRESLRHLRTPSPRNQNNSQSKTTDQLSLAHFSENLNADRGSSTTGGGGGGLHSIFNKEMNQNGEDGNVDSTQSMRTQLLRTYDYSELGGRLILLRPEKKKGNWFSLHELNERLANLKVIEEKERMAKAKAGNPGVMDLMKDTLKKLGNDGSQTQKKRNAPKIDILGQIGGTPNFMLSPPKDHLVEKYFHPDNMSSAEKLKLELKKVRDEFKMSESDCGSARVQVAQLSTKIKHLSTVLKKKDKHSRRGLEAMLDRRRKLLKYLRRTDWDSYSLVLSKFGIRDNNPDIKPAHKNKA